MAEVSTEQQEVASVPFSGEWKDTPSPAPIVEETKAVIPDENILNSDEKPTVNPDVVEQATGDTLAPVSQTPDIAVKEEKAAEPAKVIEPEPLKFANETSEKIFNLIKEGKTDDVYAVLAEQKKLAEVDKLSPSEIIKLNLQYKNKDFSAKEINDLFEDTYTRPDEPRQGALEEDEDFTARMDKYKAQIERLDNRIARDAKPATAELQKLQQEIILPDIQTPGTTAQGPTQEELEAQNERFLQSVDEGLQALNGYQTTFKDEEVELTVSYKLTAEEKAELQPILALAQSDGNAFLSKLGWLDPNGNLVAAKLAEDLPYILNKTKIINKMVAETGNQRYAEAKKSIKNIDYGGRQAGNGDMGATPEQLQNKMSETFFSFR